MPHRQLQHNYAPRPPASNIRMLILVGGLVAMVTITTVGVISLMHGESENTTAVQVVVGISGVAIMQFINMISQLVSNREQTAQQEKTRHDIKEDLAPISLNTMNTAEKAEVIEKRVNGELDKRFQDLRTAIEQMPKSPEFRALVEEVCRQHIDGKGKPESSTT